MGTCNNLRLGLIVHFFIDRISPRENGCDERKRRLERTSSRSSRAGRLISHCVRASPALGVLGGGFKTIHTSNWNIVTYLRDTGHRTGGELVDEGEGLLLCVGHDGDGPDEAVQQEDGARSDRDKSGRQREKRKTPILSKGGMTYQMQDEEGRGEKEERRWRRWRWRWGGKKVEWSHPV